MTFTMFLRALWRGWFGSAPTPGWYVFYENKPRWDQPHQVEVLDVDGVWVRYRYEGDKSDRSMKVGAFNFCYLPR